MGLHAIIVNLGITATRWFSEKKYENDLSRQEIGSLLLGENDRLP